MTGFEMSVREVAGLTDFNLGTLPEWLIDRFDETFAAPDEIESDAELVAHHLGRDWLGEWGTATVNGEELFMFEYLGFDPWTLIEPAELAEMLCCGLQLVEPDWGCIDGSVAVFAERRVFLPRVKTENVVLAIN